MLSGEAEGARGCAAGLQARLRSEPVGREPPPKLS